MKYNGLNIQKLYFIIVVFVYFLLNSCMFTLFVISNIH